MVRRWPSGLPCKSRTSSPHGSTCFFRELVVGIFSTQKNLNESHKSSITVLDHCFQTRLNLIFHGACSKFQTCFILCFIQSFNSKVLHHPIFTKEGRKKLFLLPWDSPLRKCSVKQFRTIPSYKLKIIVVPLYSSYYDLLKYLEIKVENTFSEAKAEIH